MDDGDDDDDDDDDDNTDDDHDDDTDDDNDHKNDSYTAAGAAPGASVPCSFSRVQVEGKGYGFWAKTNMTFPATLPTFRFSRC